MSGTLSGTLMRDGGKARHRLERVEIDVVAHVSLARVDQRLPVPRCNRALCRGREMKVSAALALQDFVVQRGEIPALRDFLAQRRDLRRVFGTCGKVLALQR